MFVCVVTIVRGFLTHLYAPSQPPAQVHAQQWSAGLIFVCVTMCVPPTAAITLLLRAQGILLSETAKNSEFCKSRAGRLL